MVPIKKIKAVVFDFDGTLCDSFEFVIRSLNHYSRKHGYRELKKKEIAMMRDMTLKEIIDNLRIPFYKLPFLAYRFRKELRHHIDSLPLFPDMDKLLSLLRKRGFQIGILSSNAEENVERFVRKHRLPVDFIYAKSSLFGKHRTLKKIAQEMKLKPNEILHVGDEVRDIEASKKAKVPIAAVTWGFNSEKILRKYKPDYVINKPKEIVQLLKNKKV